MSLIYFSANRAVLEYSRAAGFFARDRSLPHYRLYLLDTHSGHIQSVEDIHSADDLGAIALVNEQPREVPSELWCEGRKICRFDALPEVAKYAG